MLCQAQVFLLNCRQILGSLIGLRLLKDLAEEISLNLNIKRGGDTILPHLPLLLHLLCLLPEEAESQRSLNIHIRKGDATLLPLLNLLKTGQYQRSRHPSSQVVIVHTSQQPYRVIMESPKLQINNSLHHPSKDSGLKSEQET